MKRLFILFAAGTFAFASCTDAPKADKAEATDAKAVTAATGNTYKVDIAQSQVGFIGAAPTHSHNGTFKISQGEVMVADKAITGGKFTIDVASIQITDKDTNGAAKLKGHLASKDFFNVDTFKTAEFVITNVKQGVDTAGLMMKDATHTITGNLTLKATTKSISFPAKVTMTDASITTDASFNIDRTQFNMVYGSDKSLGDKFIRPEVNLTLHVVATK